MNHDLTLWAQAKQEYMTGNHATRPSKQWYGNKFPNPKPSNFCMKLMELTTKSPPNEWQGAQKDINAPPCRTPIALHISLLTRMVINWSCESMCHIFSCEKKSSPIRHSQMEIFVTFQRRKFLVLKKITAGYFVFQVQVLEGISSFKMLETKKHVNLWYTHVQQHVFLDTALWHSICHYHSLCPFPNVRFFPLPLKKQFVYTRYIHTIKGVYIGLIIQGPPSQSYHPMFPQQTTQPLDDRRMVRYDLHMDHSAILQNPQVEMSKRHHHPWRFQPRAQAEKHMGIPNCWEGNTGTCVTQPKAAEEASYIYMCIYTKIDL